MVQRLPETSAMPPYSGTFVVRDEGVVLGSADSLDFVGAGVSAVLGGGIATITIPGGGGAGGAGIVGWQTGTFIGTGTVLDVEGAFLSISGTVLHLLITGTIGPQGPTGAEGATGSIGPQGPAGAEGATGSVGPQGPQGATGSAGPQGAEGATGATGPQGPAGPSGSPGSTGPQGPTGPAGQSLLGIFGLDNGVPIGTGSVLDVGDYLSLTQSGSYLRLDADLQPVVFPQDNIGVVGWQTGTFVGTGTVLDVEGASLSISGSVLHLLITGTIGAQGPAGAEGATGATGPQGPAGAEGATGSAGPQGAEGATGSVGPQGPPGSSTPGFFALDDGVPLGTGTWLDAQGGIVPSLSGTVLALSASIRPQDINNANGYFTFTGVYVGDTNARLVAQATAGARTLTLGVEGVANFADLELMASSGLDIGVFRLRHRTGTLTAYLYPDTVAGQAIFDGFSIGHSFQPAAALDNRLGSIILLSGAYVEELAGDPGPAIGALTRGVFYAKTDGKAYYRNKAGVVYDLTVGLPSMDNIGVMGWDEGIPIGTGTTVNFVGAGVTATRSGSVIDVTIPGGAGVTPITGTIVGLDEGATLGSFDRINFRGAGVTASASGTYLDVNVESGASPASQIVYAETLLERVTLVEGTGTVRIVFPATGTIDMRVRIYGRSTGGSTENSVQAFFNGMNTGAAYSVSSHEAGSSSPVSAHRAFFSNSSLAGVLPGTGAIAREFAYVEYRLPNHRWTGTVPRMFFDNHSYANHEAVTGTQHYGQVHLKAAHVAIDYLDLSAAWVSGAYYEVYGYGPLTVGGDGPQGATGSVGPQGPGAITTGSVALPVGSCYLPDNSTGSFAAQIQLTMTSDASTPKVRWLEALFDKDNDEHIYFAFVVPPGFMSSPILKVHFCTSVVTGTACFGASVMCIGDGDAYSVRAAEFDTAGANTGTAVNVPGNAYYPVVFTVTLANNNSMAPGDHCVIDLFRDTSQDTAAADLIVYDAEMQFQKS